MAADSPLARSAECRVEWSWLHQTPLLRAGFEERFQQALQGGNRPLGWEMGNAAFVLSTDEDGSWVWPDSRGIWTASVIKVGWVGGEHIRGGYLPSAFLAGRGQLRIGRGQ